MVLDASTLCERSGFDWILVLEELALQSFWLSFISGIHNYAVTVCPDSFDGEFGGWEMIIFYNKPFMINIS